METTSSIIILIVVTFGIGILLGAMMMLYNKLSDNNQLKKEIDFKSKILQERIISRWEDKDMIAFAKFNTKHYNDCKNVYDKLKKYGDDK